MIIIEVALSAGAAKYANCISAEDQDSCLNERLR